jgi:hypothetical protein
MPTVYQRAAARRDLVEQFVHLAEQVGYSGEYRDYASVRRATGVSHRP